MGGRGQSRFVAVFPQISQEPPKPRLHRQAVLFQIRVHIALPLSAVFKKVKLLSQMFFKNPDAVFQRSPPRLVHQLPRDRDAVPAPQFHPGFRGQTLRIEHQAVHVE